MNVLVAVASKHGATRGIAEAIAGELRSMGIGAEVGDAGEIRDLAGYDAVVLGSAVYMGKWMSEATGFADRHQAALRGLPVWLFGSGPLGADEPHPRVDSNHLDELMDATGARDHRTFAGRLDKRSLGVGERLITRAVKAPEGDFREWEAIRNWADEIASALQAPVVPDA